RGATQPTVSTDHSFLARSVATWCCSSAAPARQLTCLPRLRHRRRAAEVHPFFALLLPPLLVRKANLLGWVALPLLLSAEVFLASEHVVVVNLNGGEFPGELVSCIMLLNGDIESKEKLQSSVQGDDAEQDEQINTRITDATLGDSGSLSASSNDNKKVSREDIELVQNLIERCLQLYMNKGEVVRTLSNRARIEPGFTTLVWQKLEEENSDFFRAYYIRLKLKKQINLFNHLLEHQYHLMKYPVPHQVPFPQAQNGIRPMPVNNLPMGYPVLQQPGMAAPGQPHVSPMAYGPPSNHVVNGIPAPGGYHPICMNSGNGMMENETHETAHATTACSASEMAVSPSSAMSSNHVSFTPSEISAMCVDESAANATFGADVGNGGPLHMGSDGADGSSLGQQIWDFSLSDLSADLTNLGDLSALENYSGNPFLPSDSDLLLDSPDHDDIVEYFADAINGPSQSDEEKP
ncbi:hypothetical protein EJB05_32977, partial [Eragrostis curvula]